jgi:hypothetical protein
VRNTEASKRSKHFAGDPPTRPWQNKRQAFQNAYSLVVDSLDAIPNLALIPV